VHQRTEQVNALRSMLYEYGYVIPQGIGHIRRIEEILNDPSRDLPEIVREECRDLLDQIAGNTERISLKTEMIKQLAAQTNIARQLQTMPFINLPSFFPTQIPSERR
jgi:transposase